MTKVETIIIGGGVMGTAAACVLAKRGREVLLLEQFTIGHDRGSSHGASRILRFAYFEHPDYARLALAAEPMWRSIERECGVELVRRCGGLDIGPPDGELAAGSLRACRALALPHECLDATAMRRRFPFVPDERDIGVHQPDACILAADKCVESLALLARQSGASIAENTTVQSITASPSGVTLVTSQGPFRAKRLIVTAGSWTSRLLTELNLPLRALRKFVAYFAAPTPDAFAPGAFPVFIYQSDRQYFYGLPIFGHTGVKVAEHSGGDEVDPRNVDRKFCAQDETDIRRFLRRHLPMLDAPCIDHQICLYTMSPDSDFIIDRHPLHQNIVIAAGFSGHGFKFAPVIGEILADLAERIETGYPIDRFRITRFG